MSYFTADSPVLSKKRGENTVTSPFASGVSADFFQKVDVVH